MSRCLLKFCIKRDLKQKLVAHITNALRKKKKKVVLKIYFFLRLQQLHFKKITNHCLFDRAKLI